MTSEQRTFIKQNWLTATNLVFLIAIIVNQAKWQQEVDSDRIEFRRHMNSDVIHQPFQEKIQVFVPRIELDARLNNMENQLDRIEDKIDD